MGKLVHVQRALEKRKTGKGTQFIDAVTVLNDLLETLEKPALEPARFDAVTAQLGDTLRAIQQDFADLRLPDHSGELEALRDDIRQLGEYVTKLTKALTDIKIEVAPQPKREFIFDVKRNSSGYMRQIVAKEQ